MDPSFVSVGFCVKFFILTIFLSQSISEKSKKKVAFVVEMPPYELVNDIRY